VTGEDINAVYVQTLLKMYLTGDGEKEEEFTRRYRKFNFTFRLIRAIHFFQLHRIHWILHVLICTALLGVSYLLGVVILQKTSDWVGPDAKIVRSKAGLLAMAPGLCRVGDKIALFKGSKTPFVIRQKGSDWELIGEAYVHGIMYGGAFDRNKCKAMRLV
jgi:hypothetical protein